MAHGKLESGMSTEAPTDVPPSAAISKTINELVERGRALYSLPAIAAEVIQLTNSPKVDARALKDCIELDPALTAKILRVVNSSLFGLIREVSDLNQAIALLGTKPLKLLVLGFSLPESLFCEVARKQLDWYWSTTLARAVAAREISEQMWERSGDDAFLAGLLEDIGILVLLGELKGPYAQLLGKVIDERVDLDRLELESLGFNHRDLSAALLEHWNMPELLVDSISEPRKLQSLRQLKTPAAELARILHLAELLAELVAKNRLEVLPDLLEVGAAYCGLDKERLNALVASLQPKVQQLAETLSLDLCDGADYTTVLAEAHSQMSEIAESVAEPLSRTPSTPDPLCETMLEDVAQLRGAVDEFLRSPISNAEEHAPSCDSQSLGESGSQQAPRRANPELTDLTMPRWEASFSDQLTLVVGRCRSRRQPLSVLLLEVSTDDARGEKIISQVLDAVCCDGGGEDVIVEVQSPGRRVLVLPGYERQEAVRRANTIFRTLEETFSRLEATGISQECSASAGVSTVTLPVKNFPPSDLIETAERCLAAAQSTGSSVVKSLEIY